MIKILKIVIISFLLSSCSLFEDIFYDEKNFDYLAFPDITLLGDGRVTCVFYNGWAHLSLPEKGINTEKGGKIMISYSADFGDSWSEPQTLIDSPNDDRDPSIVQLSNNDILCNFFIL